MKMLETGRHSVDLPISKTLVALTRVRSLRDPSTNSISKFTHLVDNLIWETNSCSNNGNGSVENGHYGIQSVGDDQELECRRNLDPEPFVENGFRGPGSGSVECRRNVDPEFVVENGFYGSGSVECRRNVDPEFVVENGFYGSGSVECRRNIDLEFVVENGFYGSRSVECRRNVDPEFVVENRFSGSGSVECRRNVAMEIDGENGFCGSGSVEHSDELKHYEKEARAFISKKSKMVGRVEEQEGVRGLIDEIDLPEEPVFSKRSKHGNTSKSMVKAVEDRTVCPLSSPLECNGDGILCGLNDNQMNEPRGSASLLENGMDLMGSYHGGMCCCWSRTQRLQDQLFPHLCRCSPSLPGQGHCLKKLAFGSSSNSRSPSVVLPSDTEVLPLLRSGGRNVGRFRASKSRGCFRSPRKYLFRDVDDNENENSRWSGSYKIDSMLGSGSRELALHSDGPRTLSQKFKPRSFNELVGQNMVALSLANAILKGKVAPVYLFQGPHGTGKTSTARIFAAALNCLSLKEHRPCGFCQSCILFFSGRSRDVKELDAAKANCSGKVKALLKRGALTPVTSRFRVVIVDGCHLLRGEAWAAVLNSLDELPRHAVFIMVTADPDKLPRAAVSRCQRYHFSNIKEVDIASKLNKICVEENLDCDKAALEYIAIKSNGSLRDAETMLEQLSLLGQRITVFLIYELIGSVSDDELLDLLDLALSADNSSTVRKARELMRSRVEPMALISQLANLIMDILAGRYQLGNLTVGRNFFGRNALTEVELQKLRNALKILSETEKQLKTSKNKSTWFLVALLQFGARESSPPPVEADDPRACQDTHLRENGFCSTSVTVDVSKHPLNGVCNNDKLCWLELQNDTAGKLDAIWTRIVAKCQSQVLKDFLLKEGKLSSICVHQGLATIELEFCHPDHVSRAEKSWKNIATSLQHVLGCNIEIRIKLASSPTATKNDEVRKSSPNLSSCSRRAQSKMVSTVPDIDAQADNIVPLSKGITERNKYAEAYSFWFQCFPFVQKSDLGQIPRAVCFNPKDSTIATATDNTKKNAQGSLRDDSLKEVGNPGLQYLGLPESENQPSCFSKTMKLQRWLRPSDVAHRISRRIPAHEEHGSSIPRKTSLGRFGYKDDPYVLFSSSNQQNLCRNSSEDQDLSCKLPRSNLKLHCWRAPKFPLRKAWKQQRRQQWRSQFLGRVLPCATVKEV